MAHPTPYQIAAAAEHLCGRANIAAINKAFRAQDESDKWPINGRFNATERAIGRLRREQRAGWDREPGLAYALALDQAISLIVNGAV